MSESGIREPDDLPRSEHFDEDTRHGPQNPSPPPAPPAPSSVRRATRVDSYQDEDHGTIRLDAAGEDTVVASDRTATRQGTSLTGRLRADNYEILGVDGASLPPAVKELEGRRILSGFRRALAELTPTENGEASLVFTLLDDLPGAALVSGYAKRLQRPERMDTGSVEHLRTRVDQCAGWARDATIGLAIRLQGRSPLPRGPTVPQPLEQSLGADAPVRARPWMRRARRLDVSWRHVGARRTIAVDSFFRDSHIDDAGVETVLHEYTITATVDPEDETVEQIEAAPRVLPWQECPLAADSANEVVGMRVDALRREVHRTITGVSSCTHLNDAIRLLGDVPVLAAKLDPAKGPSTDSKLGC